MSPDTTHDLLGRLVGHWITEATHVAMPGTVVHGTIDFEWLEGERFLIQRSRTDHPEFPDAICILGRMDRDRAGAADDDGPLRMHYFDSRGVFRELDARVTGDGWSFERLAPGFSQRATYTFADGGGTMVGLVELCEDGVTWKDDLRMTCKRRR